MEDSLSTKKKCWGLMKNGQVKKQRPWVPFITSTLFDHPTPCDQKADHHWNRAKENCKVCWRFWQTGTVQRVTRKTALHGFWKSALRITRVVVSLIFDQQAIHLAVISENKAWRTKEVRIYEHFTMLKFIFYRLR